MSETAPTGRVLRGSRGPLPPFAGPAANGPRAFHRTMPGYEVTPLKRLDGLARELGVAELWVKDESSRLGLPSFKILGGSWAVHRIVMGRLGRDPQAAGFDDLRAAAADLDVTLCTATDGNHGRGVARMARLLGFGAIVYVPHDMAPARREGIASEAAEIRVVAGDYDDAVASAARAGEEHGWEVVADVAYGDYTEVPTWVMQGYDTILAECDDALPQPPTAVLVQAGVGALAGAVLGHYAARSYAMRFGVVEPLTAACLLESAAGGAPTVLASSEGSTMAGLNCGTPSLVAWPLVHALVDLFVAIDDERAYEAMRSLAAAGIVAGESGAASLGGLLEAVRWPEAVEALALDADARVLVLNTEGATDPHNYSRVVGAAVA